MKLFPFLIWLHALSSQSHLMTRISTNKNVSHDAVYLEIKEHSDSITHAEIFATIEGDTVIIEHYRLRFNDDIFWYTRERAHSGQFSKYAIEAANSCQHIDSIAVYDIIGVSELNDTIYYFGNYMLRLSE